MRQSLKAVPGLFAAFNLLFVGGISGCYSLRPFPPSELAHLDGYDIHNESTVYQPTVTYTPRGPIYGTAAHTVTDRPYRVLNFDGDPMDFNSRARLYLDVNDVGRIGGRFESIQITEQMFQGRLLAEGPLDIQPVQIPLTQIKRAEMRMYSFGKTFALIMGITLGTAAVATGLTFGLIFGSRRN